MWNSWAEYQRVASMQPTLEGDPRLAEYTRELLRDEEIRQRRRAARARFLKSVFRFVVNGLGRDVAAAQRPAKASVSPVGCG